MRTSVALLLLGSALAQTSPSISDILGGDAKTSTSQHQPEQNTGLDSSLATQNGQSSIGSILGAAGESLNPKAQSGYQQRDDHDQHQKAGSPHVAQVIYGQHPQGSDGQYQHGGIAQKSFSASGMMSSLLGGGAHGGSSGTAQISEQSRLIVSGIVESFMHKVHLLPGEKTCLERNVAQLAADVAGTCQDLVSAIKALIPSGPGHPSVGPGAKMNKHTQGTLASAGMDGAIKLTSLVTLSTSLLKNCVEGDALAMLNATARHFINMRYVGHRLLVSGVDIAHSLSDGIIAFESHHWRRFGADIGTSIRKVLLSNATNGTQLPEGVPEESIIQQTTEGLMDGFFVRGSTVEITDAARPDVDIRLNLHRCIAGNQEFFKEIFLAIWSFIAQVSANGEQHGLQNPFTSTSPNGGQPKWMGELMIAMMQVPMALGRCNVGQDSQQMLLEAIKSIQYLKIHFQFPRHMLRAEEATKRMAMAIDKWTTWDFKGFGVEIGKLLREFVLTVYPQAYSVDADGRLRRNLIGASAPSEVDVSRTGGAPFSMGFLVFFFGGAVISLFVALVAMRSLRTANNYEYRDPSDMTDSPGASDVELASNFIEVE